MPNVLLEALGLGIPVLAASIGGMANILVDNENALLFQSGNHSECCQILRRAAQLSVSELHTLGENGQRLVAAQFTHQAEAERYLATLPHVSSGTAK
ncbi:MAG: glycosyltransferase family 4 protein [Deltaproteobacteria bacterium]|nr:glycosyltransferase family 4 protein [Deltaproteobacteria bacterium]